MLEGNLINLRAPEMADLARNTRWVNDREVTRFLAMRYAMSQFAEESWLRARTGQPLSYENALFAIETKDGRHIGNVGLERTAPEDRKAMLGILIGEKDCWSQGYGTDAIVTLLRFAFDEMNLNKVWLTTYDFNERGQACYRKCGFVEEGRMREARYSEGAYHDELLMSVLRDEFYALHGATHAEEVAR
ncbi:MAG TPA: GNAT family protein [Dehalococcoidia bacterium]|nr:GNAT family protein [Dehalococcoidia bacterium]